MGCLSSHGRRRTVWVTAAAMALAGLSGCASFSRDGGFGPVEQAAKDKLGQELRWARSDADRELIATRVNELLARPLSADDAVQIALLNNRGLQASFQELGIAEADFVQAGRLPNPGLSFGRLQRGDEVEVDRGLHFNLPRLLGLPLAARIEARHVEQVQAEATAAVVSLAFDARTAYFHALAAEEAVRELGRLKASAAAGAELAQRMAQAGNFNALQRAREQGVEAEAALNLAQAERAQRATRERLIRRLGLSGAQTQFVLPERLPELPRELPELPDVERRAMSQRIDVQAATREAEQAAARLGQVQASRFVNVLELGYSRNGSNKEPTQRGWDLSVELPLFDGGGARVARAEAVHRRALDRAAERAVNARSEVREAYGDCRAAFDIARRHRDEVLPLRRRIADESVLRYNGMLIGVFELLAEARALAAGTHAAILAQRDFWLAQTELDRALIGPGAANASPSPDAGAAMRGDTSEAMRHE